MQPRSPLSLRLTYFAAARDLSGTDTEEVLIEAWDLAMLRSWLAREKPRLAPFLGRMRFAINGEFADHDAVLRERDEVVLMPPVAGGSVLAQVRAQPLSVDEVMDAVRHPSAGAITTFVGVVRDHHQGTPVARLDYEAYSALADKEMTRILEGLMREHPGSRLAAVHRVGELRVGDAAVVVAASSAHRAEAFELCRRAIDLIKATVPVWKKEWTPDGTALWVNLESDERG